MSSSNSEGHNKFNRRQALLFPARWAWGRRWLERPSRPTAPRRPRTRGREIAPRPAQRSPSTQYGKVRGFLDGGVFTFKGIPYGQDTGGENRWLPAKPPKPWDGEYPALIYGAELPAAPA